VSAAGNNNHHGSGTEARSVLVVDDDATFRERLLRAFRERGFEARGAAEGPSALALAREDSPEFAVVDLRMPGPSGLEVVRGLKEIDPTTHIVVLTGYGSIATAVEAVRLGAVHYLTKPADLDDVLNALNRSELAPGQVPPTPTEVPTLARMEWEHINRVLMDCGGNISQAARLLGLHRRSLQRKLAKFPVAR
jgi:two-component system response regulator RegA